MEVCLWKLKRCGFLDLGLSLGIVDSDWGWLFVRRFRLKALIYLLLDRELWSLGLRVLYIIFMRAMRGRLNVGRVRVAQELVRICQGFLLELMPTRLYRVGGKWFGLLFFEIIYIMNLFFVFAIWGYELILLGGSLSKTMSRWSVSVLLNKLPGSDLEGGLMFIATVTLRVNAEWRLRSINLHKTLLHWAGRRSSQKFLLFFFQHCPSLLLGLFLNELRLSFRLENLFVFIFLNQLFC